MQIISAIAVFLSISMIFIILKIFQSKYSFVPKILIVISLKIVISPPTTAWFVLPDYDDLLVYMMDSLKIARLFNFHTISDYFFCYLKAMLSWILTTPHKPNGFCSNLVSCNRLCRSIWIEHEICKRKKKKLMKPSRYNY